MEKLKEIVSRFAIRGAAGCVEPFGSGLINDTYRVVNQHVGEPDYVLQRINHAIFRDVGLMQRNIVRITEHIRARLAERGEDDIERKALRVVPTLDGEAYLFDGQDYWRMTVLIPRARSYERVTPELAYETGRAFGDFQGMLSDIGGGNGRSGFLLRDGVRSETNMTENESVGMGKGLDCFGPSPRNDGGAVDSEETENEAFEEVELGATIPDFHNMEYRLEQLREAIRADRVGRVAEMQHVVDEVFARADEMCAPQRMAREGVLPRRISHCDTKVNNVLFDEDTGRVLCVIDLDTTMPGFVMSDFGDFVRTAANTGDEDDRDLSRVGLNMKIFREFARGYLETAGGFLTPVEVSLLPFGARLLTYMQAVRFLTDYLDGDRYYKVSAPDHNRVRVLAQMAMLQSLEEHEVEMKKIISSFAPCL
ncbi:MAG: aminoglycoside phosphotransferase family protein [Alistipes sp.]|jgi:hypothetical protein|nr:aminoglycoside phosphotransferase family protein [Alistipes sp.]